LKKRKLTTIQRIPDLEAEEKRREKLAQKQKEMLSRIHAALPAGETIDVEPGRVESSGDKADGAQTGGSKAGGGKAVGAQPPGLARAGGGKEGGVGVEVELVEARDSKLAGSETDRVQRAFQQTAVEPNATDPAAKEVRRFLTIAVSSLDSYRSRLRVQNSQTGKTEEVAWLTLVGATIRELEVGPRIRRLLFEIITSLLPEQEDYLKEMVAEAAGLPPTQTVSPSAIERFKHEGLLMAFVAKLFVDSKTLMADAEVRQGESYFAEARSLAAELMRSDYLTRKDHVFLEKCRQQYGGDLTALVDNQKTTVISAIQEYQKPHDSLEQALRSLVSRDYGIGHIQPLQSWWREIKEAFSPRRFVYAKIDELRAAVQEKLQELERQEPVVPEKVMARTGSQIRELAAPLNNLLRQQAGVELDFGTDPQVNLFQTIRDRADLLGRRDLVEPFIRFVSDEKLAEIYAKHKVAVFRRKIPDLRRKVRSTLIVLDELFRSAPLNPEHRTRLADLRQEMLSFLASSGVEIPRKVEKIPYTLPFAMAVFELLSTENQFDRFNLWLEQIRDIYSEASRSTRTVPFDKLHTLRPQTLPLEPAPVKGAATLLWIPAPEHIQRLPSDDGMPQVPSDDGMPQVPSDDGMRQAKQPNESFGRNVDLHSSTTQRMVTENAASANRSALDTKQSKSFWQSKLWPWNWFRRQTRSKRGNEGNQK
jgi:hypothetical protein